MFYGDTNLSTSSLLNFTVPLGNTGQSPSTQGLLMPKLKNRWSATFLNFGVNQSTTVLTQQIQSINRPDVTMSAQEIDIYNSKVRYAGKPTWGDLSVTVLDDMLGSMSKLVGSQLQKQFDFNEQASASSAIDYKFQVNLTLLDGGNGQFEPNVLETWEMYGCFINKATYGEMDYKDNTPMLITLAITFDNALQTPLGSGVGTNVGRTLGTVAI